MKRKRHARRIADRFKSVHPCGSGRPGNYLKANQLVGLALDDLIIAVDTPSPRPFQPLFEDRSSARRLPWYPLNIQYGGSPQCIVRPIQNEIKYSADRSIDGNTFFRVRHGFLLSHTHFNDWTDFDGTPQYVRNPGCQLDSLVQVLTIQDVGTRELFFRFGKWPVRNHPFAFAHTHGCRGMSRLQRRATRQYAPCQNLLRESSMTLHQCLQLLLRHSGKVRIRLSSTLAI